MQLLRIVLYGLRACVTIQCSYTEMRWNYTAAVSQVERIQMIAACREHYKANSIEVVDCLLMPVVICII
jgi:hypothetical protein